MNLKIFFGELTRHNVYKVADAYAVVGSLLIQRRFFPFLEIPNWAVYLACAMIRLTRTCSPKSIYLQRHER